MRVRDFFDYWRIRRHLQTPWSFLWLRKRGFPEPWRDFALRGGGRIRVRNAPMDFHIVHRVLGRDEYRLDAFRPGSLDTVIDLGAHLGAFSLRASPLARRVLAFEPFEENYQLLVENLAHLSNVTAIQAAVAPKDEERDFYVSDIPSAGSFYPVERHPVRKVIRVPSFSLATLFRRHEVERCDLLKIDVEGAEYPLLFELPAALWPLIRAVCLEYDPLPDSPPSWTGEGLEKHLREAGYRIRRVPSKHPPGKGMIWAVRQDEPSHPWC